MRFIQNFLIWGAALWAVSPTFAQNYTLSPADTLNVNATLDNLEVANFTQIHLGSDSLRLSWEKISETIPATWEASLCDIGHCYNNLPNMGSMDAIPVGDDGLMSLHITPHTTAGTAVIRYALWDATQMTHIDTLTWIVKASTTDIAADEISPPIIYIADKQLFIKEISTAFTSIEMMDMQGRIVFSTPVIKNDIVQDVSFLTEGIFCVRLFTSKNTIQTKLILLK